MTTQCKIIGMNKALMPFEKDMFTTRGQSQIKIQKIKEKM